MCLLPVCPLCLIEDCHCFCSDHYGSSAPDEGTKRVNDSLFHPIKETHKMWNFYFVFTLCSFLWFFLAAICSLRLFKQYLTWKETLVRHYTIHFIYLVRRCFSWPPGSVKLHSQASSGSVCSCPVPVSVPPDTPKRQNTHRAYVTHLRNPLYESLLPKQDWKMWRN